MNRTLVLMVLLGLQMIFISPASSLEAQETSGDPLDQALNLISQQNYNGATEVIHSHLKQHPDSGEGWFLLGVCQNRLGLYLSSYETLSTARTLGVQTRALQRELGMSLQGQKKWRIALHHLKRADKENAQVWLARAQVQAQRGQYKKAIAAADRVIELEPELSHRARFVRAYALARTEGTAAAQKELDRAIADVPKGAERNEYETIKSLLRVFDKKILDFYRSIFYRKKVDKKEGMIRRVRIAGELKETVSKSIDAYRNEVGGKEIDPEQFWRFVEEKEGHEKTLNLLEDLQELFRRIREEIDLSSDRQKKLQRIIVRSITPDQISRENIIAIIQFQ